MTIQEYITQKFQALHLSEANLIDISEYINPDDEYEPGEVAQKVGEAMVAIMGELVLTPRMSNVSENGFSVSWDYSKLGQYYMWLCRKYDVDPDMNVVAALDISTITDKSDIW